MRADKRYFAYVITQIMDSPQAFSLGSCLDGEFERRAERKFRNLISSWELQNNA